jgi:sec-independent protein translocase protein TatB
MVLTPTIEMANLGMADSLILMVLALVVFGPRRLPEIGRQIGKLMYEFRKASNDFKFQMEEELRNAEDADRRKKEEERLRAMALQPPAPTVQTIEAGAGAAIQPVESPYPNEAAYPVVTSPVPETPPEEAYPRIQPPSTGEQVSADRPTEPIAEAQTANETDPATSPEAGPEPSPENKPGTSPESKSGLDAVPGSVPDPAAGEQSVPATEQAAHHG